MSKPAFTKRHYTAIARTISKTRYALPSVSAMQWHTLVQNMADLFQGDNQGFNRMRFIDACHKPWEEQEKDAA